VLDQGSTRSQSELCSQDLQEDLAPLQRLITDTKWHLFNLRLINFPESKHKNQVL